MPKMGMVMTSKNGEKYDLEAAHRAALGQGRCHRTGTERKHGEHKTKSNYPLKQTTPLN
jgi:hypothetical protein